MTVLKLVRAAKCVQCKIVSIQYRVQVHGSHATQVTVLQLVRAAKLCPVQTWGQSQQSGHKQECDVDCRLLMLIAGSRDCWWLSNISPQGPSFRDAWRDFQVTFDLVATNPANGKTFVNTLEKGKPIDNRVGTDSMVKGLDEALTTMKAGGVRRVYCPGELAYQTPLKAAPGSPAVPAKAPIIFDVALLLVPGLEEEDQSGANEFADLFS